MFGGQGYDILFIEAQNSPKPDEYEAVARARPAEEYRAAEIITFYRAVEFRLGAVFGGQGYDILFIEAQNSPKPDEYEAVARARPAEYNISQFSKDRRGASCDADQPN